MPSPQRNVSASSAPASTDALSNQGEMAFRSNMNEGWRSNSGTWVDDDAGEFALVGHLRRGLGIAGLVFSFRGTLTPSLDPAKTGQRRARSHFLSPYSESTKHASSLYDIILHVY
jgi:hypothetical protein